jgi:dolichyl-phosphate beta-glucosyltransferase
MKHLSIIIPAYNEEGRVGDTLRRIYEFMKCKSYKFEVIVVDDGSCDGTVGVAEKSALASECSLKVVKNGSNRGKGYSVKNGIMHSDGEYILFSDADLSTPIEEVDKLSGFIEEGFDIAIGSRALDDSRVNVRQPWYREAMGKVFNFFVRSMALEDFRDTQCGFKLFRYSAAKDIASALKIDGFSFDVEMLYLARKKGYSVKEVPVTWHNSPKSKVNPLLDSARMFIDLIKIRVFHG